MYLYYFIFIFIIFEKIYAALKDGFADGAIASFEARDSQLRRFLALLKDNKDKLIGALVSDLKSKGDAILEYKYLVSETCETIHNFKSWMQPRHVSKTIGTECSLAI